MDNLPLEPLTATAFGGLWDLSATGPAAVDTVLAARGGLPGVIDRARGLLVLRGLDGLQARPDALVTLAAAFGPEVENIRETLTAARYFHDTVPEILVLSNKPSVSHKPPPRAPLGPDGRLRVEYPHQTNWHTDQSYRRPPPDVTLLLGLVTPPADQGQTLFSDCAAAFDALDPALRERLRGLEGIHAMNWAGRQADDVRAGGQPKTLLPHQMPVRQPMVRTHPSTGREALYICDSGQMDFVDGPIVGLEPGPDGAGAQLVAELMAHVTQPRFVYAHEWQPGDLVIADNRCLLHAATWYDAATHAREMWRCTVMGNPGAVYAGEAKSWVPRDGSAVMEGLEDA